MIGSSEPTIVDNYDWSRQDCLRATDAMDGGWLREARLEGSSYAAVLVCIDAPM